MATIDDIRTLLTGIGTDIPAFIKTGIPENVRSQNVRALHQRNNEAVDLILDVLEDMADADKILHGTDNPNVNPPAEAYTAGYFFVRWAFTSVSHTPIEFYIYTGVPALGWFELKTSETVSYKYGSSAPAPADAVNMKVGDYYVQTDDGTAEGAVQSVFLYTEATSGSMFFELKKATTEGDYISTPDIELEVINVNDRFVILDADGHTKGFVRYETLESLLNHPGPEGPRGEPGVQGPQGASGANGSTPFIGGNGNWWIADVDTGVKASSDVEHTLYDDEIAGIRSGMNHEFTTSIPYQPGSLEVYLDGLMLTKGNNNDFVELRPGTSTNGALLNRVVTSKNKLIFKFKEN